MAYVQLNVYYFGKKHINSGTYVITKQVDDISERGFKTTLSLVRIAGESEFGGIDYSSSGNIPKAKTSSSKVAVASGSGSRTLTTK